MTARDRAVIGIALLPLFALGLVGLVFMFMLAAVDNGWVRP